MSPFLTSMEFMCQFPNNAVTVYSKKAKKYPPPLPPPLPPPGTNIGREEQ